MGNNGAQVYTNSTDWIKIYPTSSKGDCHETFDTFISDQAKEETMGQMRKNVREAGVHYKECAPYVLFRTVRKPG